MTTQEFERRFGNYVPQAQDTTNIYAVLVPLVEREGEFHLLFEVRAGSLRRQPNEVCFPGGRMEEAETAQACAIRETTEELGIPGSAIHVIGTLDYIAHYSNIILYPVLAQIDAGAIRNMALCSDEVEDTFLVPLSFFREHPPALYAYQLVPTTDEDFPYESIGFREPYPFRNGKVIVPVYEKYCGHVVWGLTGRIVRWLTEALCKPMPVQTEELK
ncbi:MAG: CoA pyrophosphatase [Clostridia bacterium]|nr:CoA pyrophosphatase [Clostridia bacterium]